MFNGGGWAFLQHFAKLSFKLMENSLDYIFMCSEWSGTVEVGIHCYVWMICLKKVNIMRLNI